MSVNPIVPGDKGRVLSGREGQRLGPPLRQRTRFGNWDRPPRRKCLGALKKIEQRLSKLLLKTAQSSLNVIKPSRSINARKTSQLRSYRGEAIGRDFRRGRF